jgi:hypothetical protein
MLTCNVESWAFIQRNRSKTQAMDIKFWGSSEGKTSIRNEIITDDAGIQNLL